MSNIDGVIYAKEKVAEAEVQRILSKHTTEELIEIIITLIGLVRLYSRRLEQKTLALLAGFLLCLSASCSANDVINDVGVDRFAHAGVSYIINDQLHRAGMNDFWAGFTTLCIGAAKEVWIDDHWDNGDFVADCAGVFFYQIRW